MKARILRTSNRVSTHVLVLTIGPTEANKILEDMDTSETSSYASKSMFMYLLAIADENSDMAKRINSGEEMDGAWPLGKAS
jgi:hypothetical protein